MNFFNMSRLVIFSPIAPNFVLKVLIFDTYSVIGRLPFTTYCNMLFKSMVLDDENSLSTWLRIDSDAEL